MDEVKKMTSFGDDGDDRDGGRTQSITTATTMYKDTLFKMMFSDEMHALSLYNAITNASYPKSTPVKICTQSESSLMAAHNDLAFSIGDQLVVLCEHQSTINPNMPLRFLRYVTEILYSSILDKESLYKRKLVEIPAPQFFVLYNGKSPLRENVLRLSTAFRAKPENSIEITAKVLDIRYDKAKRLIKSSPEIAGYSLCIAKVQEGLDRGKALDVALSDAIEFCISHGVMSDWFENNLGGVLTVLKLEYEHEIALEVSKAEGKAEGVALATKITAYLFKQTPISEIVKATGVPEEEILSIRDQLLDAGC